MADETHAHLTGAGQYDCAPEPLPTLRHSTAHLLAQAVKQLFPGVRLAIGPPIENGFYYDFQRDVPFTEEDLTRLEGRMRDLAKADYPIVREERSREDAIRDYRVQDEPFKVEILEALPPDVVQVSFYRQGEFVDLCRGPHVPSTGHIQVFKLLSSSGAYWRGDEHRPMLQRIYGTAWFTQEELDRYVWSLEEAKRRDHRKLGRELELFAFHDVSPGAPFWLPKGMVVFRELERYSREMQDARGYLEVSTPILVNKRLWEQSGHWEHYAENMFRLEIDEQIFSLKPMNCPESTYIYRQALRSYRDLPLRYAEMGRLHRNERSGTLTGLFRVRQITMDDAHIYCRPDQLQAEITAVLDLVRVFYRTFGLEPRFRLATRPDKFLGTTEQWDQAEAALEEALRSHGLPFVLKPKDGNFYGPKIDIHIEDVLGRDWQLATIQADLTMLPERFELEYVDADGKPKRPVAIHRAIFGSFERFIGILTEHFAGAFPTWLAPVQARVLPVSAKHAEYAGTVHRRLADAGVRAELDDRSEKLGYKVREAQLQKVPYVLVVGEREAREGTASVRKRGGEDAGVMPVDRFLAEVTAEIRTRAVTSRIGPERG
jgi:threonyl-tRNA synthetase